MSASRRLGRALLDVPIFYKTVGMGAVVASIFGLLTLRQAGVGLRSATGTLLEEHSLARARHLADALAAPLAVGDLYRVQALLAGARREAEGVRYVIVSDRHGEPIAHTFDGGVPPGLRVSRARLAALHPTLERLRSAEGRIYDAAEPIVGGTLGMVRVGLSDERLRQGLGEMSRAVLSGLALSTAAGVLLALLLSHLITGPIHELVVAVNRVGAGELAVRAPVRAADEIGRLAAAFNRMAAELATSRDALAARDRERTQLIDRLVTVQEEERRNLARELHDELGQSLLALLLSLQLAEGRSEPGAAGQAMELRVRGLIDEVRRLAWGMHPSILDEYGLDSALARHAEEVGRSAGVAIDYAWSGQDPSTRLPPRVEVTLYRLAQEALTNVVRHSGAQRASVVVVLSREGVTLLVEDDGCGFDPARLTRSGRGIGLAGMRERSQLLGGTCTIESAEGRGTTVRAWIPLGPDRSA
jgi:signal transduction histidine kinase